MAQKDNNQTSEWVDRQLALLDTSDGFTADPMAALDKLKLRQAALRRQRQRLVVAGGLALSLVVASATLPSTRAFAAKCVDACAGVVQTVRATSTAKTLDFELRDTSGKVIRLEDYRGQIVLINFWATWCPPCREEMPMLADLQRSLGHKKFAVLAISMDGDDPGPILEFQRTHSSPFPMLVGNDAVARQYGGVETLPTTFLIDYSGQLVWQHTGLLSRAEIEPKIAALTANASTPNSTAR